MDSKFIRNKFLWIKFGKLSKQKKLIYEYFLSTKFILRKQKYLVISWINIFSKEDYMFFFVHWKDYSTKWQKQFSSLPLDILNFDFELFIATLFSVYDFKLTFPFFFLLFRYVAICKPFLSHTLSKLSRACKFIFVSMQIFHHFIC